jgi:C_GCAxxG_C_C family probable redox protein
MSLKSDIAAGKFSEGFNCAQSVLLSFCDEFHFDQDIALTVARGFGGGMGRKQEVCGAVSGGIMVLGLRYGNDEKEEKKRKELIYSKTRELMDRFAKKRGTFICRKLLDDCDLTTEQGQKQFKDNDLSNKTCKQCVRSAVEILETMITQPKQ